MLLRHARSKVAGLEEVLRAGMSRLLWAERPCILAWECLTRRQGSVSRIAHMSVCMQSLVPKGCATCRLDRPAPYPLLHSCCLEIVQFLFRHMEMSVGVPGSSTCSCLDPWPLDRPTLDLQRWETGGAGCALQHTRRRSSLVNFTRHILPSVLARGWFRFFKGAAPGSKSHCHLRRLL